MHLVVTSLETPPPDEQPVEVVERKGIGHPDTVADGLAEAFGRALVRFYLEHWDTVLHHNVDKVLVHGGASQPAFGGGRVTAPIQCYLAGRAVLACDGVAVPVEELAAESARGWLDEHLHALDPSRHVDVIPLVRPGSVELVDVFERRRRTGVPAANDTSCGVGYAPLSELERVVLEVERDVSGAAAARGALALGEDVKVMGVRTGDDISLTVACAIVDRHTPDLEGYVEATRTVESLARSAAARCTARRVEVEVNAADDLAHGKIYLTVTGTSAESGDDGQAGRGNRPGGLITPYRPMVMESAAGKNPVTHVGKSYSVVAGRIAERLVAEVSAVAHCQCVLVSRIGHPVRDPWVAHVAVGAPAGSLHRVRAAAEAVVREEVDRVETLWRDVMADAVHLF